MVEEFDGRLKVGLNMSPGGLTVAELSKIGVARIRVGPAIQFMAMDTFAREAEKLLAER
jgi:2-methylisocitrate lyase-like PEP mutase family enzyme